MIMNECLSALHLIDKVCGSGDGEPTEEITTHGSKKTLITIDRIRRERSNRKWVTFDQNSSLVVQVPYANSFILVPISFCDADDIKHVLSYRWAGAWGSQLNKNDAPVDFLCISATEKVWVDYLNHLNDTELIQGVIENMGSLYISRPVHAKYLHDFGKHSQTQTQTGEEDAKGLSRLLACLTRGWIWQEIAFTGPEVTPPDAECVTLLVELIKTGSEIVRCLIHDGFFPPPKQKKNVNEVIKFAIDVLWRARNLADNESAHVFFIQDEALNEHIIKEAIEKVRHLRMDHDGDEIMDKEDRMTMKVLAAMDNLENANFTKVEDSFCASFSTLLQSNTDYFGPIEGGEVAPKDFHKTITSMLEHVCCKNDWDVELWQQCVIDHPLSQLDHPRFESIHVVGNEIEVHIHGMEEVFKLKLSYNRSLQGQELDKSTSTESIEGTHEILNLSYRINKGKMYVIGFQTTSKIRVVPRDCLMVSRTSVEKIHDLTMSSRWTQTTWYSRDKDWLEVLKAWKDAEEQVPSNNDDDKGGEKSKKGGIFGRKKK